MFNLEKKIVHCFINNLSFGKRNGNMKKQHPEYSFKDAVF